MSLPPPLPSASPFAKWASSISVVCPAPAAAIVFLPSSTLVYRIRPPSPRSRSLACLPRRSGTGLSTREREKDIIWELVLMRTFG